MSHIEEGKTNLAFPDPVRLLRQGEDAAFARHPAVVLLKQAIALVAKQYSGEVKPYYYNFVREEQSVNTGLALHIPIQAGKPYGYAIPRGIGLVLDETTGDLKFLGDPWAVNTTFYQQVQKDIIQKYTALAHVAALRLMDYQVSTQEVEGRITITGVTYA